MKDTIYDHYIAIDWAIKNMAIARMTKKSNKITVIDVPADLAELQTYIKTLEGSKILAIEETGTSQWLYTELKDYVDKILICDPHRNKLLNEGAQNDKIDASKLVQLLKAGLMKEVYHSGEDFLYLRRLVSGYDDLVQSGVRVKNQRYNLLRACGKNGDEKGKIKLERREEQFVLESLARRVKVYEEEKERYEQTFAALVKRYKEIRNQKSLPGIGDILATKIVAIVVTPYRFPDIGHYKSYAGLIKLEKVSGGRVYSKKNPRYSRALKSVYKTAVSSAIKGNNPINDYYEYLMREKNYPEHNARHQACRKLAALSLGVFKSGKKYKPFRSEHIESKKEGSSGL